MADDFERGGSKLYAALARASRGRPASSPTSSATTRPRWEAPLRLFGGVHYLELSGVVQHPWPSSGASSRPTGTGSHASSPSIRSRRTRCSAAGRCCRRSSPSPTGVRSTSSSSDRAPGSTSSGTATATAMASGRWGSARRAARPARAMRKGGPPAALLRDTHVEVRGRIGIDRRPVDVTTDHGRAPAASLCLGRPDCASRAPAPGDRDRAARSAELHRRRLRRGAAAAARERDLEASHRRLPLGLDRLPQRRERSRSRKRSSGGSPRVPRVVSYEIDRGKRISYEHFVLEVQAWPRGERRRLARLDGHANPLEWGA